MISGILLVLGLGLIHTAAAHSGINDSLPTTNRADYVYATINAPCNVIGWHPTDSSQDLGGDADGDGICDDWETSNGLKVDFKPPPGQTGQGQRFTYEYKCVTGGGIDPQCPSPTKKDVYVELDWMKDPNNSHVPLTGVIQAVQDAYANSPVTNTGDTSGITLHVQYGERPDSSTDSKKGDTKFHKDSLYTNQSTQLGKTGFYRLKQYTFGTVCERFANTSCPADTGTSLHINSNYNNAMVKNLLTAKFQVFHYALVINTRAESGESTSTGWAEQYGNDHVWSLGSVNMGNAEQQKAVFMHELGHNFDLKHGGTDTTKNNPNYFSVMNPIFEFRHPDPTGKDPCRPLDYSNKAMNALVENNLVESAGVKDASNEGYKYPPAPWSCSKSWTENAAGASLADQPSPVNVADTERFFWYTTPGSPTAFNAFDRTNEGVNWNNDIPADDSDTIAGQDINSEGGNAQTLNSNNDWAILVTRFDFGNGPWQAGSTAGDLPGDPDSPLYYPPSEECNDESEVEYSITESYTTGCTEIKFELPDNVMHEPPLDQIKEGIAANQVKCNNDLLLFNFVSDDRTRAACVGEEAAIRLESNGWIKIET